jgi:hypothetical protein
MKLGRARALLLVTAAIMSCGKGGGSMGSTGDAGVNGPTNLVVSWTLAGKPASAATCMAGGAAQIFINLSGTIDPTLHQSTMVDCSMGTFTFGKLLVEDLGTSSYLEGTLLDATGMAVPSGLVGVTVLPTLGTTDVTLAFFAPSGAGGGGMGGAPASSSSSQAASSSHAASSSSGGHGGASAAASSSSSAAASSSSSSSASSSGSQDASADG